MLSHETKRIIEEHKNRQRVSYGDDDEFGPFGSSSKEYYAAISQMDDPTASRAIIHVVDTFYILNHGFKARGLDVCDDVIMDAVRLSFEREKYLREIEENG